MFPTISDLGWIIPLFLVALGLFLLTSVKEDIRQAGFSYMLWASIIYLVWCALTHTTEYYYLGIIGIFYSVYGYWRNIKQPAQIDREYGVESQ
jgi:hypothetical protein